MAGCRLDDSAAMLRLGAIFEGYESLEEGPPPMIVLIGPFFAGRGSKQTGFAEMRSAFTSLASLIVGFPRIQVRDIVSDLITVGHLNSEDFVKIKYVFSGIL